MESMGCITPSTLSTKDLPWIILWNKEKCTLCGRCTAVCPVRAIELGVHRKRAIQVSIGLEEKPGNLFTAFTTASTSVQTRSMPVWAVECAILSVRTIA